MYDGTNFISPWARKYDQKYEKGNLAEWEWGNLTDDEAWYEGAKVRPNGLVESYQRQAKRVYSIG